MENEKDSCSSYQVKVLGPFGGYWDGVETVAFLPCKATDVGGPPSNFNKNTVAASDTGVSM